MKIRFQAVINVQNHRTYVGLGLLGTWNILERVFPLRLCRDPPLWAGIPAEDLDLAMLLGRVAELRLPPRAEAASLLFTSGAVAAAEWAELAAEAARAEAAPSGFSGVFATC